MCQRKNDSGGCLSVADILQSVLDFSTNGEKKAVLETEVQLSAETLEDYKAEISDYQPNEVTINVTSNTDAILVFNDAYDSGWKVFIDGIEESEPTVSISANRVTVSGFTIQNSGSKSSIYLDYSKSNTITDNAISDTSF